MTVGYAGLHRNGVKSVRHHALLQVNRVVRPAVRLDKQADTLCSILKGGDGGQHSLGLISYGDGIGHIDTGGERPVTGNGDGNGEIGHAVGVGGLVADGGHRAGIVGVGFRPGLGNVNLHTHADVVYIQLVNVGGNGHGVHIVQGNSGLTRLSGALPLLHPHHDHLAGDLRSHVIVRPLLFGLGDFLLGLSNFLLGLGNVPFHRLHLLFQIRAIHGKEHLALGYRFVVRDIDGSQLPANFRHNIFAGIVLQGPLYRWIELLSGIGHQVTCAAHSLSERTGILHGHGHREAAGTLSGNPVHLFDLRYGSLNGAHQAGHRNPRLHAHIDLVLIGVAEILGQGHLTVIHQGSQLGSRVHAVPHFCGHIGDPPGKGRCDRQSRHTPVQVGQLALGIGQGILQLGDLVLVSLDLLIQLGGVLGIQQLTRLHCISGRNIDAGNLAVRGGGIGHAVRRHGGACSLNGGGETAVGGPLRQGCPLLLRKEQLSDPHRASGHHRSHHRQQYQPLGRYFPPGPGRGRRRLNLRVHLSLFYRNELHVCILPFCSGFRDSIVPQAEITLKKRNHKLLTLCKSFFLPSAL